MIDVMEANPTTHRQPVVLVTGGTQGLGLAICHQLGASHHLWVGGRSRDGVEPVVASLPSAEAFVADLADAEQTEASASTIDRLDVLVHCAGIVPPVDVGFREAWRRVFEVNVVAVAHLTELLLPQLRASRGLVVFVNSGSGLSAFGDISGYSASKFALTSYADGLREAERGRVRVASVHPGRIDTAMQRELQRRAGREYVPTEHMSAASVAAMVKGVIDSPASAVVETLSIRPS